MRKSIAILLLAGLLLSLCACAKKTEVSTTLEFQGIPWNSSPEEVFEKLGLDQETLSWGEVQSNGLGESYSVVVSDWEVFGESALSVGFFFVNYIPKESDYFGLSQVQIFYPEDCDKEAVLENVRKQYGPEPEEFTEYSIMSGEPVAHTYTRKPGRSVWFSQRLMGDVLSDQGKAEYREVLGEVSDETFQAALNTPMGHIVWMEDYYGGFEMEMEEAIAEHGRVSWLNFSGTIMAQMRQEFENE